MAKHQQFLLSRKTNEKETLDLLGKQKKDHCFGHLFETLSPIKPQTVGLAKLANVVSLALKVHLPGVCCMAAAMPRESADSVHGAYSTKC